MPGRLAESVPLVIDRGEQASEVWTARWHG
jgi:hypothetical protein